MRGNEPHEVRFLKNPQVEAPAWWEAIKSEAQALAGKEGEAGEFGLSLLLFLLALERGFGLTTPLAYAARVLVLAQQLPQWEQEGQLPLVVSVSRPEDGKRLLLEMEALKDLPTFQN